MSEGKSCTGTFAGTLAEVLACPAEHRLASFFAKNRATMDNVEGLARWTGLARELVAQAVEALVGAHFLERFGEGSKAVYMLVADNGVVQEALQCLACEEGHGPAGKERENST